MVLFKILIQIESKKTNKHARFRGLLINVGNDLMNAGFTYMNFIMFVTDHLQILTLVAITCVVQ
jgi:hypothetical protein